MKKLCGIKRKREEKHIKNNLIRKCSEIKSKNKNQKNKKEIEKSTKKSQNIVSKEKKKVQKTKFNNTFGNLKLFGDNKDSKNNDFKFDVSDILKVIKFFSFDQNFKFEIIDDKEQNPNHLSNKKDGSTYQNSPSISIIIKEKESCLENTINVNSPQKEKKDTNSSHKEICYEYFPYELNELILNKYKVNQIFFNLYFLDN